MNKLLDKRFKELKKDLDEIKSSEKITTTAHGSLRMTSTKVSAILFHEWSLKVRNLIILCTNDNSMYYKEFEKNEGKEGFNEGITSFTKQYSLFNAFYNDWKNGYLTSLQVLAQAEIFESELEQAEELLVKKYKAAAAVIAGVVLEIGLRNLCTRESIDHGKLDGMNANLAKLGIYNKLQQKKITALAEVRNSAAHGKEDEYTHDDVKNMIRDIESFLSTHL